MSKDRELLRQALEKLEFFSHMKSVSEDTARLIAALRRALEQPARQESVAAQQEPVAWGIVASNTGRICQVELDADEVADHNPARIVPLYAAPQPRREPLTDAQIEQCMKQAYATVQGRNLEQAFARTIEAAHGITGEKK